MPELFALLSDLVDLFSSLTGIFTYVAVAYGLCRMAQSIGLKNPWLSCIPFCQAYILGAVADEYGRRNQGKTTTYRRKLLGWQIAQAILSVLLILVAIIFLIVFTVAGFEYRVEDVVSYPERYLELMVVFGPLLLLLICGVLALYIVYLVYYFISLHNVFELFAPTQATPYLLLSIFVPLATPILFLILAKKNPIWTDADKQSDTVEPLADSNPLNGDTL